MDSVENIFKKIAGFEDITNRKSQELVKDYCISQNLDGWISNHDRSDDYVEMCIFNPLEHLQEVSRVILGPS